MVPIKARDNTANDHALTRKTSRYRDRLGKHALLSPQFDYSVEHRLFGVYELELGDAVYTAVSEANGREQVNASLLDRYSICCSVGGEYAGATHLGEIRRQPWTKTDGHTCRVLLGGSILRNERMP